MRGLDDAAFTLVQQLDPNRAKTIEPHAINRAIGQDG